MSRIIREDLDEILSAPLDWERFRGKSVLITGANGFLPAYLVETFLRLNETRGIGCRVLGIVRNLAKARERFLQYQGREDLVLLQADVSEPLPAIARCDFVIHAASQASPKYFISDPVGTMQANLAGTYQLLELATRWNAERFLFFSSSEIYGEVSELEQPIRESGAGYLDVLNPRSCYAESKRAGEALLASFCAQYDVEGVVVRPFHTYGPGMALDDGRVFSDFVNCVVTNQDLVIHSDGRATRSFCYLADAVAGFLTALLRGESSTAYNVGAPNGTASIRELAEMLVELFPERSLNIAFKPRLDPHYAPSPVRSIIPDIQRLSSLGWSPRWSLRDGFKRTVEFYEASGRQ